MDVRAARVLARGAQPLPHRRAGHTGRRSRRISLTAPRLDDLDLLLVFWSGHLFTIDPIVEALARLGRTRGCACSSSTPVTLTIACAGSRRRSPRCPTIAGPVVLASCAADARARENSVHGFFTGALLRQLRRPRRPGARTLDLLDAFNRAADEAVGRIGREPLFSTNGAGRLRIPILTQTPLPFDDQRTVHTGELWFGQLR